MGRVPGMAAAERRLARLGVEYVDLTHCDHGYGCEAVAAVGRARRRFRVHASPSPLAAVEQLADAVEHARRRARTRRR